MGVTRRVVVVDGNNLLYRAVKAMERSSLSVDGVPTGALLVFINSLSRHVREEQPDRLVVCWDGGRSQYRTAIYGGYKANRTSHDDVVDDPEGPFALAKQFLTLANIHHVIHPGYEADDVIAAYWRNKEKDHRLIVISGDKDFFQLLDGWTELARPGGDDTDRWTANRVRTVLKCKPEDIPKVMALTGDSGDGVPGVPGFGHITACKALAAHNWSLDDLLMTSDAKWAKKIAGHHDDIVRNKLLVDLREPIPGLSVEPPPRFEPTDPGGMLWQPLLEFLLRFKLVTVQERLLHKILWHQPAGAPAPVSP